MVFMVQARLTRNKLESWYINGDLQAIREIVQTFLEGRADYLYCSGCSAHICNFHSCGVAKGIFMVVTKEQLSYRTP